MPAYFAVWATDHPEAAADRARVREAHRARLRDPAPHPVKVVIAGPTFYEAGGGMNGTLLIIEAASIDAVRAFIAEDPYVLAGVYASVDVRPWHWGLGAPAAQAP